MSGTFLFAFAMWSSWLALTWMFIMGTVRLDFFGMTMWIMFLAFGIFGSAYGSKKTS